MTPYDQGLAKNPANYTPLTPLSFLPKAAAIYPQCTAVIHGGMLGSLVSVASFTGPVRTCSARLANSRRKMR